MHQQDDSSGPKDRPCYRFCRHPRHIWRSDKVRWCLCSYWQFDNIRLWRISRPDILHPGHNRHPPGRLSAQRRAKRATYTLQNKNIRIDANVLYGLPFASQSSLESLSVIRRRLGDAGRIVKKSEWDFFYGAGLPCDRFSESISS